MEVNPPQKKLCDRWVGRGQDKLHPCFLDKRCLRNVTHHTVQYVVIIRFYSLINSFSLFGVSTRSEVFVVVKEADLIQVKKAKTIVVK